MSVLSSWFRSILAFDQAPTKQEYSIVDPSSAEKPGIDTVVLAVDASGPTIMASLFYKNSGVKLFEKQFSDGEEAQNALSLMATDLSEAQQMAKEGKIDEGLQLSKNLLAKYSDKTDNLVQPNPPVTNTQASQEPLQYKGWKISKFPEGGYIAEHDVMSLRADSLDVLKGKIDNMLRRAYGKKLVKSAEIVMQNLFFSTPDEALQYQEKMKKLQGPETGEGTPLWEQTGGEEVAPSNESTEPEEDTELAPPSLSFDRLEKDKARSDKDIGKRIKEQVKTEVESALEQKSASVFGNDQEELVEALRKNGRNWDEIKKIFVKELSYNEDDTTVFLDSIRQKEEGGPEGLPLPPKPPEDLVSPETHDKLVKEIEDKSEPKPELKPESKPLVDEIARADNAEIRKVATLVNTSEEAWKYVEPIFKDKLTLIAQALGSPETPFDASDEEYSLWLSIGEEPNRVDIQATLSEAKTYGDEGGFGINVSFTTEGGRILGQYSPYNYTSDVWTNDLEELVNRAEGLDVDSAVELVNKSLSKQSLTKARMTKKALNPLQEPPAVGQAPGQPLAAPVEEAPTMDSPVPPSQDTNPEPEFLEAPQEGDRVYVMGDYETGEDGYEGTMGSDFKSKGDDYAVVYLDNGESKEVALHRVVKASQKKVAQIYYEKKAKHEHVFEKKPSGIEVCPCGRFRFPEEYLKTHPPIVEQREEKEADLEVESKANEDVIRMFIDNSFPKDKMPVWGTNNLKITKYPNGWALVNYQTPILYRANGSDVVVFNTTKYSQTTSKIQNQIRSMFLGQSVKETDEAGIYAAIDQSNLASPEPEANPELQSLHESALKLQAELIKLADDGEGSLLAVYKLDKMVTSYNEAAQDWSGETQDFGYIDKGEIHVNSMEEALAKVKEIYGMDFEPVPDEPGRFETNQTENAEGYEDPNGKYLSDYSVYIKLYKEHTASKKAELEREGEIAVYFHKEGIEKKASDDSAFEGNGWCRVWIQDDEISSDRRYPEILKLQDETARIDALKDLARDLAHEALRLADSAGAKVGVQAWFESLSPSDHDNIDWVALANPQAEGVESAQEPKVEKQAADPVPAPEVPVTYKELERAPKHTDRSKTLPATQEQAEAAKNLQISMASIESIKDLVKRVKADLDKRILAIQQAGGLAQLEEGKKKQVDQLAALINATENKLISYGEHLYGYTEQTEKVGPKLTDAWRVEKLVEKFAGAAEYLKAAEAGAQNMAKEVTTKTLTKFPKLSRLDKQAGFLDSLTDVYNNVMEALKLVVSGNGEEQRDLGEPGIG